MRIGSRKNGIAEKKKKNSGVKRSTNIEPRKAKFY